MKTKASDVAFSPAVKRLQSERGSRAAYARHDFRSEVDDELLAFLAAVDTAFFATASKDGQPYVQHRGGPPGFIRVLDDRTLAFVDFTGNKQYVSAGNLRENDRFCLLLMDYAHRRRVKIWGTARIVPATAELVEQLAPSGYVARPEQVVLLSVSAWDVNCPRHIPQKVDAADVAAVVARLEGRIAELETENRSLRARSAT